MAKDKKGFVLYADQKDLFNQLSNEKAGELIKFVFSYVNDENPITEDLILNLAFTPIKQQLKRDLEKYEGVKNRKSISGREGNLKRWNPELYKKYKGGVHSLKEAELIANNRKTSHTDKVRSHNVANIAVKDTVNVTDKVTVTDKVKDINNISCREADFKKSLQPFLEVYSKDMLNKFYLYWTEISPRGKKMLFEKQKTFDVGRRLKRWSDNNFNNNNIKPRNNEEFKQLTAGIRKSKPDY